MDACLTCSLFSTAHSLLKHHDSWGLITFLATSQFASPAWVLVLDPSFGILQVLTKSLSSLFSLLPRLSYFFATGSTAFIFQRLFNSPETVYPTFYQTVPLGYCDVTKRTQHMVSRIRSKFISLSHYSPEFVGILGRAGGSVS